MTTWTHDLYVSMDLRSFEEPRPHHFRERVTIGDVTYHRMTGELYARLKHNLDRMEDDPEVPASDYLTMLARFEPIDDWVRARVTDERLAEFDAKLAAEIERKRGARDAREKALGKF